jgi:hypothetical protein
MTTNLPYKISQRKVNGWTNYETFAAMLWMDSDAKQYKKMHEAALVELRFFDGDKEAAAMSFATSLQAEIEKAAPTYLKDVYQDLLNGAISAIVLVQREMEKPGLGDKVDCTPEQLGVDLSRRCQSRRGKTGRHRAAPLRSWPPGRRSGRVATEPYPPPGPRSF